MSGFATTLTYHILHPEETVGMLRSLFQAALPIPYRNRKSAIKKRIRFEIIGFVCWIARATNFVVQFYLHPRAIGRVESSVQRYGVIDVGAQ